MKWNFESPWEIEPQRDSTCALPWVQCSLQDKNTSWIVLSSRHSIQLSEEQQKFGDSTTVDFKIAL